MAIQKAVAVGFNFGDMSVYVAGGGIPEGDYALEYLPMHEQESENYKPQHPRLGILLTAHPLGGGEAKTKFLSFGGTVHESFGPNPDNPKMIMALPNGKGVHTMPQSSNWAIHLKSLYDSGLPQGVFTNDLSVLDGVHVHLVSQNEPEERKGFKQKAKTGDVEQTEAPRRPGTIPVVTEFKEGGMPWEGGGGIPEAGPGKQTAPVAAAPKGKVAPKVAAKVVAAAAAAGPSEEDLLEQVVAGITAVLEKKPEGVGTLMLRTGTFKAVKEATDEDTANLVINTFFSSDEALAGALEQVGYTLDTKKKMVLPPAE